MGFTVKQHTNTCVVVVVTVSYIYYMQYEVNQTMQPIGLKAH